MAQYLLTEEDIAKLGLQGQVMPGEPASEEEKVALGVVQPNTAPDGSPIAPPEVPVAEQVIGAPAAPAAPATPASNMSMQDLLAQLQGTMAPAEDDGDPYGKLSKTQRRMLAFAAISDAGRALQGKEGTMVTALLGDFTARADQARKAKAAALQTQMLGMMMGGASSGPVDMNDPNAIRKQIEQLTALGMASPQLAPGIANRIKYLQGEVERLESAQTQLVKQESAIGAIDALLMSPDLGAMTGFTGTLNEFFNEYGAAPKYAKLKSYITQIQGLNFLEAYQELKGGGSITEIETKQATAARTRLEEAMKGTPEDLRLALIEVRNLFNEAMMKNPAYGGTDTYSDAQKKALEAARKKRQQGN